jgi:hypothetical protein
LLDGAGRRALLDCYGRHALLDGAVFESLGAPD